ncbi:MAG: hypothetical protein COB33_010655 [Thiotrichaceae bacterium]|nr:hypothetical protein [Thiotrichaceae bacterium]
MAYGFIGIAMIHFNGRADNNDLALSISFLLLGLAWEFKVNGINSSDWLINDGFMTI